MRHWRNSNYVFPGNKKDMPLSNMSMTMALRRLGKNNITVHGFRSTFRDWAAENTSHPREVCEQALAHALTNSVEAAYRRSDLFDKRLLLMQEWSEYLLGESPKSTIIENKLEILTF
jgi:integrase